MKKRFIAFALVLALALSLITIAGAVEKAQISAELRPDFKIFINDVKQSFADANGNAVYPVLYNGTTYLPLRAVGNALGMKVGWNGNTQTVTLDDDSSAVTDTTKPIESDLVVSATQINAELRPDFKILINSKNQTFADANGNTVYPILYNGTTYLPLRAVGNALNMAVGWDGATQTVTLDDVENTTPATPEVPTTPDTPASNIIKSSNGFGSAYTPKNPPQSFDLRVVNEYKWISDTRFYYVVLVVENISDETLFVTTEITFDNSQGKQTGEYVSYEEAVAPGTKRPILFLHKSPISVYNYTITSKVDPIYTDGTNQLKVETYKSDGKSSLKVKNTGTVPVEFAEYLVLYFCNERVVDWDFGYCTDSEDEIKAGETEFVDRYSFVDFDKIESFVWGRIKK